MSVPRLRASVTAAAPDTDSSGLLVLLPSLGTTSHLWDLTLPALRQALPELRILRVDLPGHGASAATREPFTVAELAEATLRLIDEVGGGRFHLAGVSLGGAIALELAASAAERVLSLSMFASGSRIASASGWHERADAVRASGTASLVAGSAARWFAPDFLSRFPAGPGGRALRELVDVDDEAYALCCGALAEFDRTASLDAISVPALVVAGADDTVTTSASMERLANALPTAEFVEITDTAHLLPLEAPARTAELIAGLVGRAPRARESEAADARASGMRVRRAVLGDAHVDASLAGITSETADFQDFITRYAWGEVWARPQLSRQERSIATLASLVTGGHEAEIRMHVRAALRNGLSRERIAEVIMHTALYAGLPAANSAMGIMRAVFTEAQTITETEASEENDGQDVR